MTEREVLKLALEALEDRTSLMKWQEARDAIKEALREHAMYEVQRLGQEIQPEQSENSDFQPDWMNYQQGYMDGMSQAIADKQFQHEADLYTTPPQRKPLTDEQIHKASTQAGMQEHYMGFHSGFIRFAREIEAAHGIKE